MNKKVLFGALISVSGLCLLSSCSQNEDLTQTTIESYNSNWENLVGEIDPNQNYVMANNVTIKADISDEISDSYNLYVYSDLNTNYPKLLGNFENVKAGSTTLNCDVPLYVKNLYFRVNQTNKEGKKVSFLAKSQITNLSATLKSSSLVLSDDYIELDAYECTGEGDGVIGDDSNYNVYPGSTYSMFKYKFYNEICKVEKTAEDGTTSDEYFLEEGKNHSDLAYDFKVVYSGNGETETVKFYPIFVGLSMGTAKIGAYIYNEGADTSTDDPVETVTFTVDNGIFDTAEQYMLYYNATANTSEGLNALTTWEVLNTAKPSNPDAYDRKTWTDFLADETAYVLSKPFEIELTKGQFAILWITPPSDGNTYTSEHENNYEDDYAVICYDVATTENGYGKIIGFEDKLAGTTAPDTDYDYNDIVLYTEAAVENEEAEQAEYFIAIEDLGDTDDFDFNDVVMSVKHTSGTTTATVTLYAAGGTLPVEVAYNGTTVWEEVHGAFGKSSTCLINTDAGTYRGVTFTDYANNVDPVSKIITVADGFSIAKDAKAFTFTVTPDAGETIEITPDNGRAAPQAIVLTSKSSWKWPLERISVLEAYDKDELKTWIGDRTVGEGWTENYDESKVYDSSKKY